MSPGNGVFKKKIKAIQKHKIRKTPLSFSYYLLNSIKSQELLSMLERWRWMRHQSVLRAFAVTLFSWGKWKCNRMRKLIWKLVKPLSCKDTTSNRNKTWGKMWQFQEWHCFVFFAFCFFHFVTSFSMILALTLFLAFCIIKLLLFSMLIFKSHFFAVKIKSILYSMWSPVSNFKISFPWSKVPMGASL